MNVLARFPRMISLVIVLLVILLLSSSFSAHAQSSPFTAGKVTQYPLPDGRTPFGSIAKGPDGDLWFLEYPENMVGKMTTKGAFTEYRIPTPTSRPVGITAGPDGNMWFTEWWGNNIGKITMSGHITEYPLPTPNAYPADITLDPTAICGLPSSMGRASARSPRKDRSPSIDCRMEAVPMVSRLGQMAICGSLSMPSTSSGKSRCRGRSPNTASTISIGPAPTVGSAIPTVSRQDRWQPLVYHYRKCRLYRENDLARSIHHLRRFR